MICVVWSQAEHYGNPKVEVVEDVFAYHAPLSRNWFGSVGQSRPSVSGSHTVSYHIHRNHTTLRTFFGFLPPS